RKKIHSILYSGSRRKRENLHGSLHGARGVRVGISSALRCLRNIWESRLISMQEAKIWYFLIMKMRSLRARQLTAKSSQDSGCIMDFLILIIKRCQDHWATFSR